MPFNAFLAGQWLAAKASSSYSCTPVYCVVTTAQTNFMSIMETRRDGCGRVSIFTRQRISEHLIGVPASSQLAVLLRDCIAESAFARN